MKLALIILLGFSPAAFAKKSMVCEVTAEYSLKLPQSKYVSLNVEDNKTNDFAKLKVTKKIELNKKNKEETINFDLVKEAKKGEWISEMKDDKGNNYAKTIVSSLVEEYSRPGFSPQMGITLRSPKRGFLGLFGSGSWKKAKPSKVKVYSRDIMQSMQSSIPGEKSSNSIKVAPSLLGLKPNKNRSGKTTFIMHSKISYECINNDHGQSRLWEVAKDNVPTEKVNDAQRFSLKDKSPASIDSENYSSGNSVRE